MIVDTGIFFRTERHHRGMAALERDLACTVNDPARRLWHMTRAARHAKAAQASNEAYLLIRG